MATTTLSAQTTTTTTAATEDEGEGKMETLYVTGSRLSQAEFQGGLPVGLYTAADLEKTTAMSLNNYLRTIPTSYGSDNYDEGTVNGGDGRASIGLRGLPTLMLVNGRRTTVGDMNTVPLNSIERVEVLKDGNGAVYGADAVGGVINIITKRKFDGVQLNAYYQNTTESDISRRRFEITTGVSNERGSVVLGASYFKQGDLFSFQRNDVTDTLDRSFGATSAVPNPGRFILNAAQAQSMFGSSATAGSYRVKNDVTAAARPSDFRIGLYGNVPPEQSDRFTYALYTPTVRPADRYHVFGSFDYDLLEDKVQFYGDVFYMRGESQAGLAPSPAGFGAGFGDAASNIPADYYWNQQVFGESAVEINSWMYRFVDFGPRNNDVRFDDLAATLGLKGNITDRFGYDVSWFWNRNEQLDIERNGINRARLQEILQGRTFTGARSFNPFTNPFDSGVVSQDPEMLEYLKLEPRTTRDYTTMERTISLNGQPFDLPAGSVNIVGGYQDRNERFKRVPDLAKQQAAGSGWNSTSLFSQDFTVKSLFGEVLVPVVADAPLMQKLQVGAAVRRESFSHLDDDATVGRIYLRNQFNRELTGRLSYSEGYTAPTPFDLDDSVFQSFPNLWMPWLGVSDQAQQGVILAGNADLKPTKSKSYNLGLVWSPRNIRGFSISLDYYQAKQSDIIIQDPQLYIDAFYQNGGITPSGSVFTKNNSAPYASQIDVDVDGSRTGIPGYIVQVTNVRTENVAELEASGLDFEIRYELPTESLGKFSWRLDGTHIMKYEIQKLPTLSPTVYDGVYTPNDAVGPETVPHWRGFLSTDWQFKGFLTSLKINHVGSYKEDPAGGDEYTSRIKGWTTFDLTVSYTLPRTNTTFMVGVENAFDKMPPFAISSFADKYDRSAHNILGRMLSVGISQKF